MLESFERGEISSEDAYYMGIIDEAGASLYSGDIYDNSIGRQIDDHITYMPTLKLGERKKKK